MNRDVLRAEAASALRPDIPASLLVDSVVRLFHRARAAGHFRSPARAYVLAVRAQMLCAEFLFDTPGFTQLSDETRNMAYTSYMCLSTDVRSLEQTLWPSR